MRGNVEIFLGFTSIILKVKIKQDINFSSDIIHIIRKFTYGLSDFVYDRKTQRFIKDKNYYIENRVSKEEMIFSIPRNYYDRLIDHLKSYNVKYIVGEQKVIPSRTIDIKMQDSWVDKNELQTEAIDYLVNSPSGIKCLALQTGCLAGDNQISFNRASKGFTTTIENAYDQFNGRYFGNGRKWDRSLPTFCRSHIKSDDEVRLNKVNEITYSGIKEIYRLTLANGLYLDCTKCHRIKTKKGYIRAEYCVGEDIACDTKKASKNLPRLKKVRDRTINVTKYHPYGRKYSNFNTYRLGKHRAVYEAAINNMTLSEYTEALKDENNISKMLFIDPKQFVVHHIDGDHHNDDPSNLEKLTHKEHFLHHSYEKRKNFNQGIVTYSKGVSFEFLRIDKTYDMGCEEPNHNFVANGIIVHNSGKTYCSNKSGVILNKPYLIITSGMVEDWENEVRKQTTLTDDEIYVIRGSESIFDIMKNNLKPKCVIASLETMRNFAQCKKEYENFPYSFQEVMEQMNIGTKIVDECHKNFHATVSIDLVCNIEVNIYLSATFMRTNTSTNRIFNIVYPDDMKYGEQHKKKYIDVKMFGYSSTIPEKFYTIGSYSHFRYEKLLLKTDKSYDWFFGYLMRKVIEERYIRIKKPGQKLLIIMSTVSIIKKSVEKLQSIYPNLKVSSFCMGDPRSNLDSDIIVSTLGSAGTGRDIKDLVSCIDTVSYAAENQVLQTMGRLREIVGCQVYFSVLYNRNSESHKRHKQKRASIYLRTSSHFSEVEI